MHRFTTRKRRAFTLVELLVVIGIIALLIAILFPVMGKARAQSQQVACLATLRQFAQANEIYLSENKDWYVPVRVGYNLTASPPWPMPPPPPVPPNPQDQTAKPWYHWADYRRAL